MSIMNLQKMSSKIDVDVLDEIIQGLESKMTEPGEGRPFKKKATALVIDAEPEDEGKMDLSSLGEEKDEGEGEEQSMEELLELWHKLKGQ